MRKYLVLDGLFEGGRMLTAASSAVYLTSRGLPLAEIAQLKMIQAICSTAFELPTGLLADSLGRRASLIIATLCGSSAFAIYCTAASFLSFALAEIFLALCLCFWSGAYEAYAIDQGNLAHDSSKLSQFFHSNSSVNSLAMLSAGGLGAMLASFGERVPFGLSSLLLGFLAILIVWRFPTDRPESNTQNTACFTQLLPSMRSHFSESISMICKRADLHGYFLKFIGLQFIIQPIVYYWQPWFKSLLPSDSESSMSLGIVFICFQLSILITSTIASKLANREFVRSQSLQVLCWLGLSLSLLVMSQSAEIKIVLPVFCLAECFLTLLMSSLKAGLNGQIGSANRASVMSAVSLMMQFGGFISLAILSTFLQLADDSGLNLASLYKFAGFWGIFMAVLQGGIMFRKFQKSYKEKMALSECLISDR